MPEMPDREERIASAILEEASAVAQIALRKASYSSHIALAILGAAVDVILHAITDPAERAAQQAAFLDAFRDDA